MTDLIIKPEGSEDPEEYILKLNQSGTAEITGLIGGQAYRAGVIAWDDATFMPLEPAFFSFSRPRLTGVMRMGQPITVVPGEATNIVSYRWFVEGVEVVGATGASFTPMMGMVGMHQPIVAEVTCEQGVFLTPQVRLMHTHPEASHNAMDDAAASLIPYEEVTHITIADGDWSDPAVWDRGEVPGEGAVPLVSYGTAVRYDLSVSPRFDRLRVDGDLHAPFDVSIQLLVETLYVHIGGVMSFATKAQPVAPGVTHEVIISNRSYRLDPTAPTDLDFANDPTLLGRGLLHTGTLRLYGRVTTDKLKVKEGSTVSIGDTSLTLAGEAIGWEPGTTVVIAGTVYDFTQVQDEERMIDTISYDADADETTITWTAPLLNAHSNAHFDPGVHMPYHQPHVVCLDRSIVIRTENFEALEDWQRGHHMAMHGMAQLKAYHATFLGMGRTSKVLPAGIFRNGTFDATDPTDDYSVVSYPQTAQSNIQSRYPLHLHFMGFGRDDVPTVYGCLIHGSPGWGGVHHGCEADLYQSVVYRHTGAGWVSETGDELGAWVGLMTLSCAHSQPRSAALKGTEDGRGGILGDFGRDGAGFFMRGRAMRTNACVAASCPRAFDFYHRNAITNATNLSPVRMLPRSIVDIHDLAYLRVDQWGSKYTNLIPWVDYPIIHFADNECYGVSIGMSVVKSDSTQNHDLNIELKRMLAWNVDTGLSLNYVGTYAVRDFDITCLEGVTVRRDDGSDGALYRNCNGISMGRVEQIAIIGGRIAGTDPDAKLYINSGSLGFINSDLFDAWDYTAAETVRQMPRFMVIGYDASEITFVTEGTTTNTAQDVTAIYPDLPPYRRTTTTLPFIIGSSTTTASTRGTFTPLSTNWGEFTKRDSLGTTRLNKVFDKAGLPSASDNAEISDRVNAHGYWRYDDNGTIRNILLVPFYFSDRLYALPEKFYHAIELTGSMTGLTYNGLYNRSSAAPVMNDFSVTVPQSTLTQSTTLDIDVLALSGASDADGNVVELDRAFYAPDRGRAHPDTQTGFIRYTPDPDYVGPDQMIVWIKDNAGYAARAIISIAVEQAA